MIPAFDLDGLRFGGDEPIQVSSFAPGSPEIRNQDADRGVGDGMMVGRDYIGGATWSFDMFTNVEDYGHALDLADDVAAKWLDPQVRTTPGRVMSLRYLMAGRWRRVYGRPRRYAGPDGGLLTSLGRAEFTTDFQVVDHLFYGDEEGSITLSLRPTTLGGFTAPFTTPLTTETYEEGYAPGTFAVGGRAATWPVIEIVGPVSDPWVQVGDWRCELTGTVQEGETVIVDARPWQRASYRADGAPMSGMVSQNTALTDLALTPGHHRASFGGYGASDVARATIKWRDAWNSL